MAYTTINKGSDYFNTKLYTGTGAEQSITGVGFQPDWVWTKSRTSAYNHNSYDSVRGANKTLYQDLTNAEFVGTQGVKSFDSDGFTVGTDVAVNQSSANLVAWNWLAANGTSANTDGSISSTVSANTTSGFSIVSYTGTGSNATIGHGLGVRPSFIIVKVRDAVNSWPCQHISLGAGQRINLDSTAASASAPTFWNSTEPTSSVFSVGTEDITNNSGNTYIAYCFAEKKGYSKFGSYTGNGSANGTFVYTGFKPAWIMYKNSSEAGGHWQIYDNKRNPSNLADNVLRANLSNAESDGDTDESIDILSNGYKCRGFSDNNNNKSGVTYIYMAFAEHPFVSSTGTPVTAR